jgi:uncharacterized membrane protein
MVKVSDEAIGKGELMMIYEYMLVFIGAAIPWIEIALVIPVGIVRGLSPLGVMTAAFIGNMVTLIPVIIGFEKVKAWYSRRQGQKGKEPSKRSQRAKRIWNKYGLPGLALLGPILIGIHIAAFIGMSLGAQKNWSIFWMTASLAVWTLIFGIVTMMGFGLFVR